MTTIQFKGKIRSVYNVDNTLAYEYIAVPVFKKHHCDMPKFRMHPRYSGIANSDLFLAALSRIRKNVFGHRGEIKMSDIPAGVSVDSSGFLAVVTIDV